jgi:hypothetical protein
MKTEAELQADREHAFLMKEERERISKERKTRMRELEAKGLLLAKKTDSEVAQAAREEAIRRLASEKIDSQSDVVKTLSSISARAAAFTIRDKQLEEKKRREHVENEYERRMDILMELDRLKDIQRREEDEIYKRSKRVEDRKVISEQIELRKRDQLVAIEAKEQENAQMRTLLEKYKREDAISAERKKVEIERSRLEVIAANEDAIRRKWEAKEASKKEVEDMLIYQAELDAKMLKREEEERLIEKVKKERQAKLLAEQERVSDNRDKLDEIRARRAAEDRERKARQGEREAAAKRKAETRELLDARAHQAADNKQREAHRKAYEEEELVNAAKYTQMMAEREDAERDAKIQATMRHRRELQAQIDAIRRQRSRYTRCYRYYYTLYRHIL